jgi:hypothetical protein
VTFYPIIAFPHTHWWLPLVVDINSSWPIMRESRNQPNNSHRTTVDWHLTDE